MKPRLFTFCAFVSLLLCVAFAVLWAIGGDRMADLRRNEWVRADAGRMVFARVRSYGGTFRFEMERRRIGPPYTTGLSPEQAAKLADRFPAGTGFDTFAVRDTSGRMLPPAGFAARYSEFTPKTPGYQLEMWTLAVRPWLPIMLSLPVPALWLHRRRSARRAARLGLCAACGYDLRGSPVGCPECGAGREAA